VDADARDAPEAASRPGPVPTVALVRRIQAGDAQATEELLARYRPRLARIVRMRLGRELGARFDDDDVVQEALLIAVQRFPAFELRTHAGILGWLVGIAENVVLKRRAEHAAERRDARREVPLQAGTSSAAPDLGLAARGASPSSIASRAEYEALVDAAVESLEPPDYREVILLRDYLEASWEEIRDRLGRPSVHAAQELHQRAHRRLRERLAHHFESSAGVPPDAGAR